MHKDEVLSDEELVMVIREQDQEQYAEIVNRYQDRLLRYALRLTNDRELAQDAVQKAFIKAFVNLHSFDTERKFSSWIYRIVHNESMNVLRKDKKFRF